MPGGLQMHFWQQLLRQPTRAGNVRLPACLPRPTEAHHTYALATDYGRMMTISQNHIWDILWVRSEKQSFQWKKQLNDGNHGERDSQCQNGADSRKNPITPKFITPICPIGISLKKGFIGRPQSVALAQQNITRAQGGLFFHCCCCLQQFYSLSGLLKKFKLDLALASDEGKNQTFDPDLYAAAHNFSTSQVKKINFRS